MNERFSTIGLCISTGRTGTMGLANYIDQTYPDVTALHEPPPSRVLRILSNLYLAGHIDKRWMRFVFQLCRRRLFNRLDTPVYFEVNPFMFGFLDVVDDILPGARIIHIVRHPASYIVSHLKFGAFGPVKSKIPFWMMKADWDKENPNSKWADMSPTERLAYRWHRVNREIERAENLFGERYCRVRFEDLFAGDMPGMRAVVNHLGLPFDSRLVELAQRPVNVGPEKSEGSFEWTESRISMVNRWCGRQMRRYGYNSLQAS